MLGTSDEQQQYEAKQRRRRSNKKASSAGENERRSHHRRYWSPSSDMDLPPPTPPPPPPPLDDEVGDDVKPRRPPSPSAPLAIPEDDNMVSASWDVPTLPARRPRTEVPPPTVPSRSLPTVVATSTLKTPTRRPKRPPGEVSCRTFQFIMLSAMYAKLIVVVCLAIVSAEVITHEVPLYYHEGFFTYIYGVSIIFFLYVFMCLLRASNRRKHSINRKEPLLAPSPQKTEGKEDAEAPFPALSAPRKKRRIAAFRQHQGSIFLRLGAIAFGLGTMIYIGLELGSFFEIPMDSICFDPIRGLNPILQVVFTFAQMYFIFMNSRLNTSKFKAIARFGLMHIMATNICVWIRTLVKETMKDLARNLDNGTNHWHEDSMLLRSHDNITSCQRMTIMGTIVDDSAPYLFPLLYQYCLIATGIAYITWRNIGRGRAAVETEPSPSPSEGSPSGEKSVGEGNGVGGSGVGGGGGGGEASKASSSSSVAKVDCVGSSKGLFLGLFVLVAATICLILFFVLVGHDRFKRLSLYFADVSESGVMALTLVAMMLGFARVQTLHFRSDRHDLLADLFLRVGTFGIYLYAMFSLIAGGLTALTEEPNLLVFITSGLSIIQATVQTLFIADVSRRSSGIPEHERDKPGRQVVTFLLICNITMWVIETFEMQRVIFNPVQSTFYGNLYWASIIRFCLPLTIFYRFHSSVVLAEVWKHAYRLQPN